MGRHVDIRQRIEALSTPIPECGCVLWTGSVSQNGYGCVRLNGRTRPVHRVSYELAKGQIPDGLVLDHLCRVPTCINPAHLEAVTIAENLRRGINHCRSKTHCLHGHPFVPGNLGKVRNSNHRRCLICLAASGRKLYARQKQRRLPKEPQDNTQGRG